MRLVLCDDDPGLRRVVSSLATQDGHEVVAETDDAIDALELLRRHRPDAIVVDLAIHRGNGLDVANAAVAAGCRVAVFSAFVSDLAAMPPEAVVVEKPDFARLALALGGLAARGAGATVDGHRSERRHVLVGDRGLPGAPLEELHAFYRSVGEAWTGDALLAASLDPPDSARAHDLAMVLRSIVRAEDHITVHNGEVLALLVSCSGTAPSVIARLAEAWSAQPGATGTLHQTSVDITADESPSGALHRLRSMRAAKREPSTAPDRSARVAERATASLARTALVAADRQVVDDEAALAS